jgi:predicted site-specific integrase-resolvase
MTEILTLMCALLYGKRAAGSRARHALSAAVVAEGRGAA